MTVARHAVTRSQKVKHQGHAVMNCVAGVGSACR